MIPVTPQKEPADFDVKVRQRGLAHLKKKGIALDKPLPPNTKIEPYWRACLSDLHKAYGGICAYLALYFERVTGGASVDHFIAKSEDTGLAYEWSNYRLACSIMNSRKRDYHDVLDPFLLESDQFRLELCTGHIYPNPKLDAEAKSKVESTIERLGLDDLDCRELRVNWYQAFIDEEISSGYLKKKSPFVWQEANRQGLL